MGLDRTPIRRKYGGMCNRYRMVAALEELARRHGAGEPAAPPDGTPAAELFPDRPAWVVRADGEGARGLDAMRWGFPLTTAGKEKRVTNVRNLQSPFWRAALGDQARRCLVPFTAFSEYGQARDASGRLPLYWFDVPSRPIASFAGIWRPVEGGRRVFAFLTCEPNGLVAAVHPKAMPVVLDDEGEERWLRGELEGLAEPFPSQLMRVESPTSGSNDAR